MIIKAIASDIDGTLINDNEEILEETKNILIDAQKKGIKVILASGRNEEEMLDRASELRMDEFGGDPMLKISKQMRYILTRKLCQKIQSLYLTMWLNLM